MSKQPSLLSFFSPKGTQRPKGAQSPKSSSTPLAPKISAPNTPKTSRTSIQRVNKDSTKKVLRTDDDNDENAATPKRRKVAISSDEESGDDSNEDVYSPGKNENEESEDEYEEDEAMDEEDEVTPKKEVKRSAKKTPGRRVAPKEEDMDGDDGATGNASDNFNFTPEMADSFINSFMMREGDITDKVRDRMIDDGSFTFAGFGEEKEYLEETKPKKAFRNEADDEDGVEEYQHETLKFLKPEYICDAAKRRPDDPEYDPSTLYVPEQFIVAETPGHQQWWRMKAANFDTVLLFKVGKFYELYHMDATVAVGCLNLAYMKGKFAHCGFPESAYGRFADQLVQRGYKVSRVEQTETPEQLEKRQAKEIGKKSKVVRRELCRVTTAGTRTYDAMETPNTGKGGEEGVEAAGGDSGTAYLLAIKETSRPSTRGVVVSVFGVAFIDTSLGRFHVGSFEDDCYFSHLRTLVARHPPAQVLLERNSFSTSTRSVLTCMLPSHVPVDTLASKKEFTEPEKTLAMLMDSSRLGGDIAEWPSTLRDMLNLEGVPSTRKEMAESWSALGALMSYLRRCLIDVDMVTMRSFDRFDPTAVAIAERKVHEKREGGAASWTGRRMVLDGVGLEQLSLIPLDYASEQTEGSLYSILNKCKTPFGCRLLRSWVCAPSCDPSVIGARQTALRWLLTAQGKRCSLKVEDLLESLPDLERLLQKIHTVGLAHRAREHPDSRAIMFDGHIYAKRKIKDLVTALDGFKTCQLIGEWCEQCRNEDDGPREEISLLASDAFDVKEHIEHFERAFDATKAELEGKIVPKKGADPAFDAAKKRVAECERALEEWKEEQNARMRVKTTFINIGKDKYLLEVPEKQAVPRDFEVKNKKKGFVRYTCRYLQDMIMELNEALTDQEILLKDATRRMFEEFDRRKGAWQRALSAVSTLDVLLSLAKYTEATGVPMCCPEFVYDESEPILEITEGYHPSIVVTGLASLAEDGIETSSTTFIPNDVTLGGNGNARTLLLTGPNMGGKSTLMRQVAVLAVLAHMGSMVPAKTMRLSPIDRIFTRIGASDRLVSGQSTFFVEMHESAIALRDATRHSLAIFDELGRGTGTLDGQSLAYAILQDITSRIGARSVFSTHYHGLCEKLQGDTNVVQMHMGCMVESEDESAAPTEEAVTFLYRLVPGVCPRSFGFHAARLASIQDHVIANSWRAARGMFGDKSALGALRKAAENNTTSIETLVQMVNRCF